MLKKILFPLALSLSLSISAAPSLSVVPKPLGMKMGQGVFKLDTDTTIAAGNGVKCAGLLAEFMKRDLGLALKKGESARPIALSIDPRKAPDLGDEGYTLDVTPAKISIVGATDTGVFYGIETLRQLIPPGAESPVSIPCVSIKDKPAFQYRGMMLDVSRYFFDANFIKHYLDVMALHKMNEFHWHFVDDPGWRPEIKKYPKLTKEGAFRGKGAKRFGGCYTQKQMKDIVAYASARHIEIIPEIELPAHTLSALVAYPWLGCAGKHLKLPTKQFISKDIYCAGKDTTFKFLGDVFDEICSIFPGRFIHIGGDEAKYDRWKKCPLCQKRIKEEHLKNEKALQGWMTKRVEKMLAAKGKRILGWDEILSCGVTKSAGIMIWNRHKSALVAAERGNPVVMALTSNCYLDTPESKLPGEPKAATWIPPISLRKAYSWDPMPSGISPTAGKNILGPEGCVWSDQILNNKCLQGKKTSENYVMYLTLPRLAALAEVAWTPKKLRNWSDFSKRMAPLMALYDKLGYNYRVPVPEFKISSASKGALVFTPDSTIPSNSSIHYTLDGSQPTSKSPVAKGPVTVPKGHTLKAVAVTASGKTSLVYDSAKNDGAKLAEFGTKIGQWTNRAIKRKSKVLSFDATGAIDKAGTYQITFAPTGHRKASASISKVEVFMNNREIVGKSSSAAHASSRKPASITLKVKAYDTGASFQVKATMKSSSPKGGGNVLIKRVK